MRSESLALVAPLVGFVVYTSYRPRHQDASSESGPTREYLPCVAVLIFVTFMVIAPWTARNHARFDRFILTSANGGMVISAANHPGASGGNDLVYLIHYMRELGVSEKSQAEQNIAMNDDGWRRAAAFVGTHPGEAFSLALRKLWLTYRGDSDGADLVRGFFGKESWHLPESTWRWLGTVANAYWGVMVVLALAGLAAFRRWPGEARVLCVGLLVTWISMHVVFLGGMRFHHPEVLVWAMIAGKGLDVLWQKLSMRRRQG